ncbi:MAG: hypothetical protein ACYC4B_27355, partial [Pirellulaceae bacterium]
KQCRRRQFAGSYGVISVNPVPTTMSLAFSEQQVASERWSAIKPGLDQSVEATVAENVRLPLDKLNPGRLSFT